MSKRNWLSRKTAGIIVAYIVILLTFGLPFADRNLTQGLGRRTAYQDTLFSQVVYAGEGVAVCALVAALVLDWFCLGSYFRYLLGQANTTKRAKRVILLSKTYGLGLTIAWILYGAVVMSNLYLAHFSHDPALREFARSRFVGSSAALLVFIRVFFDIVGWRRSWKKCTTRSVMAGYYWQECQKLAKAEQYEAAEQMLAKACGLHPSSISLWALRAYLAEVLLDRPHEAAVCLENAARNIEEERGASDEEKAVYEHYLGLIKAHRGLIEEATQHIEESLKLHYHKPLADFLKKLQK